MPNRRHVRLPARRRLHRALWVVPILLVAAMVHAQQANKSEQPDSARGRVLQVWVKTADDPPSITLSWEPTGNDAKIIIRRMTQNPAGKNYTAWGVPIAVLEPGATHFEDTDIQPGVAYEYALTNGSHKVAFLSAGIRVPLEDDRGKLILVVDASQAPDLVDALDRLVADCTGDGWQVIRHDVARDAKPPDVKAIIRADYDADPERVKAVFLLGHVPVPYSGEVEVDGHPDHRGAWPADPYYADFRDEWTDEIVNRTDSKRKENWNVPGDGKFDQTYLSAGAQLMIGRVDLSNMPVFGKRESLLLQQYLDKDHLFRQKAFSPTPRALIYNDFRRSEFAMTGWMLGNVLGPDHVAAGKWTDLVLNECLWGYGCAGGWYEGAGGIGTSKDYQRKTFRAVFQGLFGSYFGDWDTKNNLLRAPLCMRTYGLASFWGGRPLWYFHPMALGKPIGYSALLVMNQNPYTPGAAAEGVHIALMGDPTLRMHYIAPVPSVQQNAAADRRVTLTWKPSPDKGIVGYHVYRAPSMTDRFVRLTADPITECRFTDTPPDGARWIYMVRAVALDHGATGSYYNASQGAFVTTNVPVGVQTTAD